MNYKITPLLGINDIKLGITREEVSKLLGSPESSSKRVDYYDQSIFQIHYDRSDLVNFIEVYFDESIKATLAGLDIFRSTKDELRSSVEATFKDTVDESDLEYPCSHTYRKLGVGLWSDLDPSEFSNEEAREYIDDFNRSKYFKSIGIGDKNYFNPRK